MASTTALPTGIAAGRASRTYIEDHPGWLLIFGARDLAWGLAFAALLATGLIWVGQGAGRSLGSTTGLLAAGALYWSLIEYAMHRWFYHWRPRHPGLRRVVESFHVYHHRTPIDRRVWNAGPALVLLVAVAMGAPLLVVLRSVPSAALVLAGAVIGYALYEVVHHECHARVYRRGPLAYLQAFHLHHHDRDWRRNFGVTSPLWDWAFGTVARRPAQGDE